MKKWITVAVLVVSIVCYTGIAFAVVTPINVPSQGYPVKITIPGSYQLQTNLVVLNANLSAILVTSANVTIDLNGFAIIGGPLRGVSENGNGTGIGIDASNKSNIKVYNGTIRGMGGDGIRTGNGAIIESVRVLFNGGNGIYVNGSGTVSGNMATGNSYSGILVFGNGTVSGNMATGNGDSGILVFGNGTVSGNTATDNGGPGIDVIGSGTVSGNTVTGNGKHGIFLGVSAGYFNNVLDNNTGGDVFGGINLGHNLCSGLLCP